MMEAAMTSPIRKATTVQEALRACELTPLPGGDARWVDLKESRGADVRRMQDEYAAAEKLYRTALDIFSSIGDKYSQGNTFLALAGLYRSMGAPEKAAAHARQAQEFLIPFPALAAECDKLLQELVVGKA